MTAHKSIVNYVQLIPKSIHDLLIFSQLKGRITLVANDDFQCQSLICIVPLTTSSFQANNLTTVTILVRLCKQKPWLIPGVYIEGQHIPQQIWYLNIAEGMIYSESKIKIKQIILKIVKQIDEQGIIDWSKNIYKSHFLNNKMQNKKIKQVNQITNGKNINKIINNQYNEHNQNYIFNFVKSNYPSHDGQEFKNYNFKFHSQSDKINLEKNNQFFKAIFKIQTQQNCDVQGKYSKIQAEKTNLDQSKNVEQQGTIKKQQFVRDSNQLLFLSPFSSFKPIIRVTKQDISHQNDFVKLQEYSKRKKEQKSNIGLSKIFNSGFMPVKTRGPFMKEIFVKFQNDSLNSKNQAESMVSCFDSNNNRKETKKNPKHPKPMNKNANLPKFLIRIFIKYVDKFKNMYVKKQYDKLSSQCKKMRQWKKNDRRQHAFGLKHLKTFFQDFIQGFPEPALNRRVISKIIDYFLLEQICQNSQIPQSHRVGYLIACRVYSIRCRNASLAGRIQSK